MSNIPWPTRVDEDMRVYTPAMPLGLRHGHGFAGCCSPGFQSVFPTRVVVTGFPPCRRGRAWPLSRRFKEKKIVRFLKNASCAMPSYPVHVYETETEYNSHFQTSCDTIQAKKKKEKKKAITISQRHPCYAVASTWWVLFVDYLKNSHQTGPIQHYRFRRRHDIFQQLLQNDLFYCK
jgi:hypothetical protein